jgi:hypothetical protein
MLQRNWNTDNAVWSSLQPILFERNWKRVSFNYGSKDMVSLERGVYMVIISTSHLSDIQPFSFFSTPFYVGMSTKLRQRFSTHTNTRFDKDNLIKKLGVFSKKSIFFYKELPEYSREQLLFIEQSLIDVFGGSGNRSNSLSIKNKEVILATFKEGEKHAS